MPTDLERAARYPAYATRPGHRTGAPHPRSITGRIQTGWLPCVQRHRRSPTRSTAVVPVCLESLIRLQYAARVSRMPHRPDPADHVDHPSADDPRLRPSRHHQPVRRARPGKRVGDHHALPPAPPSGVPALPEADRPRGPKDLDLHLSVESFHVRTAWGFRPKARQIREIDDCDRPVAEAIDRVDQGPSLCRSAQGWAHQTCQGVGVLPGLQGEQGPLGVQAAQVPAERAIRAQLHLRFSDWVTVVRGKAEEFIEIVAWHLEQACGLSREVARSPIEPPMR